MKLLFIGCVHGRFDIVQKQIEKIQPDLLVLLGDLQAFSSMEQMKLAKLPQKYQKQGSFNQFSSTTPILSIFGNHELPEHCQVHPHFIQQHFLVAGCSTIKFVKNSRQIIFHCISGITSTAQYNPFFLSTSNISNLSSSMTPHYIISHEWPSGVGKFDRKLIKKFGKLKGENSQQVFKVSQINQQLVWIASHMHVNYEGWVFEQKQKIKFFGLNKCEFGGFKIIENGGNKSELEDGLYWCMGGNEEEQIQMIYENE
ncbi:Calcineurin-like phosphoesterase [Spironucleus salmonicida]|uniref:Calcineurin-like phosphoesterase n=1 Tax=Spironucleus salmonicida TaxID=348837 RepID=V6LKG3_9EUKA|nr:Calcineurin-like phosphoesterase [Spironucleus salmonicida]|eukprot:EST45057.1 Calcineurin-like phosphoesterase [Spironucleus salmonicida]